MPPLQSKRWQSLSRREKRGIILAAGIVVVASAYLLLWQPLQRSSSQLAYNQPQLTKQLARIRMEADSLALPAPVTGSLAELNDQTLQAAASAAFSAAGGEPHLQVEAGEAGQVRAHLNAVGGDALIAFLEQVQREHRWRIAELQLVRLNEGASFRADVVLTK